MLTLTITSDSSAGDIAAAIELLQKIACSNANQKGMGKLAELSAPTVSDDNNLPPGHVAGTSMVAEAVHNHIKEHGVQGEQVEVVPSGETTISGVPDGAKIMDSAGLPWDKRIHSSGKTQNKDGTWKKRKGVETEVYEQVLAEISGAPVTPEPTAAPVQEAPAPTTPDAMAVFGGNTPVDPQPAPVQEQPAPIDSGEELTWPIVLRRTNAVGQTTEGQEKIAAFLQANQIKNLALLATRPEMFSAFIGHIES